MSAERGPERFLVEAQELGYEAELLTFDGSSGVIFPYTIENGPRVGDLITLGFVVPPNWPTDPPHGPCYKPAILAAGMAGVHAAPFGPEWQHWSRPLGGWARVPHDLRSYMRHIRRLNSELPAPDEEDEADAA